MGEKASLNIGKRYWLIVFKGKSYSCTNTKGIFGYALIVRSIIWNSFFLLLSFFNLSFFSSFSFFVPLSLNPFSCYILWFFLSFSPSTCELGVGSFSVPFRSSLNLLLLAVRLLVYCSGITSTVSWAAFNAARELTGQHLMRR